jgi:hypothetical protein
MMFSIAPVGQRPSSSGPSGASSIGEALELVRARVLADKVYEPWDRNGQCLRFLGEGESQAEFNVLIREQHSSACGGDPETSPVVDRFRVLWNTKTMLWLNYSGEYVPYEEFRDERLRQLSLDPSAALPDPPHRQGYRPVPLEGQSPSQVDADDALCEALARKATAGRIGPRERDTGEVTRSGARMMAVDVRGYRAYRDCMFEHGYRAESEPPPPVPLERPHSDRPTWCSGSYDIWDPGSQTCRRQ